MSRAIKFRVWSPRLGKMIYPSDKEGYVEGANGQSLYYHCVHHTQGIIFEMTLNGRVFESECCGFKGFCDDDILQQSTGKKDKNGKEIFEGDILKHNHSTGLDTLFWIYWDDGACGFKVKRKALHSKLIGATALTIEGMHLCEIIGNIKENQNIFNES